MTDRTLELSFGEHHPELLDTCGAELFNALGYLSTWALSSPRYRHCRIIGGVYGGNPELTATYWEHQHTANNAPNPITYQLGAVWHEPFSKEDGTYVPGRFSFHS